MNPLDTLSTAFHQQIAVPPGPGVDTIVRRGTMRRRRAKGRNLAAAGVLVAGLAGAATNLGGDAINETIAADETTSSGSVMDRLSIDLDSAMSALPARPAESLTIPTPTLQGWSVSVDTVAIEGSGPDRLAPTATFLLANGDDQVTIDVARWELPLESSTEAPVTIDRHGQTVQASRTDAGTEENLVKLRWQEPGTPKNPLTVTVWAHAEIIEDVADTITFEEQPVTGATAPPLIDSRPDDVVVLAGTTDEVAWRVVHDGRGGELAVEIDGQAPLIRAEASSEPNDFPVDLISVSNNGIQINIIRLPADATASIETGGTIVALPTFELDGSVQRIAAAPIPAAAQADRVVLHGPDNTIVVLPLITPPPTGWMATRYEAN
ncbi:MAG: hypothetical protein R2733_24545 [Acidimicrobiales bacterium]